VQRIRNIAASVLFAACAAGENAAAAGMSPDPTGLWFDPAESGWGLSLVQRDDTIFALLLVYDEQHRATWYVASDVTADGPSGVDPGAMKYTGVLYGTSGPWFGGAFDPMSVTSSAVGMIRLQYEAGTSGGTMDLSYTANGVTAFKQLQPQVLPVLVRAMAEDPPQPSQVH
jgi:hypothetical protein